MLLNIIVCLIILSVLVLCHELGHFLVARAFNVRVEEFGIGYPPKIVSFKRGETIYSLNWIPFGGFNKLTTDETNQDPRALNTQAPWKKILILLAGSVATAIFAFVVVFIAYVAPHEMVVGGNIQVEAVNENSPAYYAGLEIGDIILEANGQKVSYEEPLADAIIDVLDQEVLFKVQKANGEIVDVYLTPRSNPPADQGAIGISASVVNYEIVKKGTPFFEAIPVSFKATCEYYKLFVQALGMLFTGEQPVELSGPIGLVQMTGTISEYGFSSLMLFMALLCINLAILNLFPIPGLDGGHILIVIIECIIRKPIPSDKQNAISMIGFAILIGIMLLATYQDIGRLISGVSLIP